MASCNSEGERFSMNPYGQFDNALDLQSQVTDGLLQYDESLQLYTLTATGAGVAGETGRDDYFFAWKAVQGDFILRAELHSDPDIPGRGTFGLAVRNTISDDSGMISMAVGSNGTMSLVSRNSKGGDSNTETTADLNPDVIEVERVNGRFRFRAARFGEPLVLVAESEAVLRNELHAGLFVSGGSPEIPASAVFRNVRIVKPMPEDAVQYQQYLGSRMEVLDVESGMRTILFDSEHSVQAPNWTVDGKRLIYNSNGYLYNYHLDTGRITYLNTGFAISNNNDHVISIDGSLLAISHHVAEDNNQSTIYVLPVDGSDEPQQVTGTGLGHAFLHGISPDNRFVTFTGWRNGKYDIYIADIGTMEETQLTDTPFLDDGSEYTPDGSYIYFNSNRSGAMQIWRMKPDGSEQTRVTFDENFNDWFPHISPDGRKILFLSYGTDVESGDHPFYKHVTLRMMPADGGEPRIVAYLYGGQGTINVPSWSPDSKRVAFVSNSGRFY
ncbi:MAG: biopolymer transporter TolR [Balneolaceae bacterium]|nr:MAG: biopolymer transporter TolR [Balneolaceae bacterium]